MLAVPVVAHAGSLALPDYSSQAGGRDSAYVAVYDDPAAVFYNPANLTRLPGLQLDVGGELAIPRYSFEPLPGDPGTSVKTKTTVAPVPFFNASYNFGDIGLGDLALGLGFGVSYGSKISYPSDWVYRQEVQKASLAVLELTPALAWRPHRLVAIGAGFRYQPATAHIERAVPLAPGTEGRVTLDASGHSFGASAGLGVYPFDWLSIGFSWRSATTIDFNGTSDFAFPPPFDVAAASGKVKGELPTPQVFRFGFAWDALPNRLNISSDFEIQQWSKFKALSFTLINPDGSEQQVSSPRNSNDSFVFHLGAAYRLSEAVTLRAGYAYDRRTQPESTLNPAPPDTNAHPVALGASYYFGDVGPAKHLGLHFNLSARFFEKRTSETSPTRGTYGGGWPLDIAGFLVGVTASAAFDVGMNPSAFAGAAE